MRHRPGNRVLGGPNRIGLLLVVLAGSLHPLPAGEGETLPRLGQTHSLRIFDIEGRGHGRLVVTPDGSRVVLNRGLRNPTNDPFPGLSVIDLESGGFSSMVLPEEGWISGLAVDPAGERAYVTISQTSGTSPTDGRNRVDCIDITTEPPSFERSLIPSPSGSAFGPIDVALNPAGTRLYIADRGNLRVQVFDIGEGSPTRFEQVASVPVAGQVASVTVTPDGTRVYGANRTESNVACIDTSDNTLGGAACGGVSHIPLASAPSTSVTYALASPDGKRAYFIFNLGDPCIAVVNIDPEDNVNDEDGVFQQEIPGSPISTTAERLETMAISQDGAYLYTLSINKDELLVIDTKNLKLVQRVTLQVPGGPGGVAYRGRGENDESSPLFGELYVSHGTRRLLVINPARGAWASPDPADTQRTDHMSDFENESDCPDPSTPGQPDPGVDQSVEYVREGNRILFYRPSERDEPVWEVLLQNPHPVTGQPQDLSFREIATFNSTAGLGGSPRSLADRVKNLFKRSLQTALANSIDFRIEGFTPEFRPRSVRFAASGFLATSEGTLSWIDENGDGINEAEKIEGIPLMGTIESPVDLYDSDNGGGADYRILPVLFSSNHPTYVPLTDTNEDGEPDSPAWDFDGDGLPDPDLPLLPFVAGPAHPEVELKIHFAQFGNGVAGTAQVYSQISLFNLDPDHAAQVNITLRDDGGNPLSVILNGEQVDGEKDLLIPAGGLVVLESDGQGPLTAGSVMVGSDRAVAGVILFGGTVGTAGVGVSHVLLNGFVAPIETSLAAGLDTGIAVANLTDSEINLPLSLRSTTNNLLATAELELPAYGHRSLFVDQIPWVTDPPGGLDLSGFRGLLRAGKGRVAATVIQTRRGELATLPVAPDYGNVVFGSDALVEAGSAAPATAPEPDLEQKLYFAQFGDGQTGNSNVFSQILLLNLTSTNANARALVRDGSGQPLEVDLNGNNVPGRLDFIVPRNSLTVLQTDGLGPLVDGSVTVSSDQALAGVILFGGSAGVAGVGASASIPRGFVSPVESEASVGLDTGIAVVNLDEDDEASLSLKLCSPEATVIATSQLQLDPMGHEARFLSQLEWQVTEGQLLDLSSFSGLLKVDSSARIAGTVIQTRAETFATQPVIPVL